jgi:hypothetical protein
LTKRLLTDAFIRNLKPAPAGKRIAHWDTSVGPGFGVRVTDRGVKSYVLYTGAGAHKYNVWGGDKIVGDKLNLWQGWAVKPQPGSWALMKNHIEEVIAAGNPVSADYIIRWVAWMFQNPGTRAEVVLVLRGGQGTGKGAFVSPLVDIFGQHAFHISSTEHLVGRFNAHLIDCSLLYADEAFWPGNKTALGRFKALITEKRITAEKKFVDMLMVDNALHIIKASNENWVVPADMDDRRCAVFDVSKKYKQTKSYFEPLFAEIENGGKAAMLHDLLALDLGSWHPRDNVPKTAALNEQQMLSLSDEDQWIFGLLEDGELPSGRYPSDTKAGRVTSALLFEHARTTVPGLRNHSDHKFARLLKKWGCTKTTHPRGWQFPPLPEMRARWGAESNTQILWPEPDAGWAVGDGMGGWI